MPIQPATAEVVRRENFDVLLRGPVRKRERRIRVTLCDGRVLEGELELAPWGRLALRQTPDWALELPGQRRRAPLEQIGLDEVETLAERRAHLGKLAGLVGLATGVGAAVGALVSHGVGATVGGDATIGATVGVLLGALAAIFCNRLEPFGTWREVYSRR